MTRLIKFTRGVLSVVLALLGVFSVFFGDFNAPTQPLKEDCNLYFAAISDIHMTEETARRDMLGFGLQDMQEFERRLDALVLAGDLTDNGELQEWEMLKRSFLAYDPADRIVFAQGNHDTWTEDEGYDLARDYFINYNNVVTGNKIKKEYYSTQIKGYTFIVLASEDDRVDAEMNKTQRLWLKSELKKAAKSDKPIFVISHWPLNQSHGLPTTWGEDNMTLETGGIGKQSARVERLLKMYDNVIMISGHIHNGFSNEEDSARTGYVSVESDGSFHSVNLPSYMYSGINGRVANGTGFNFEVYDDEVIIRGRSYSAGVWYTDYVYTIDLV